MIRQACAKDEPDIKHCAEEAYSRYIPLIGRKPAPMVADFKAQIAEGHVYVAFDADLFLGFIIFFPENEYMLLENVAVLPQAAGHGVGKALIGFCESEAKRRGFNIVQLYTNEKMTDNLTIYPRLGYYEVARRSENGFNRVFFEKNLS